ncbi:MAG: hypothetical protein V1728_00280 [Candidatus Micrarchaeota archaeon]
MGKQRPGRTDGLGMGRAAGKMAVPLIGAGRVRPKRLKCAGE